MLACGREAVLSHRSAARFWKLLPYPDEPDEFDVSVPGRRIARRPRIRPHRAADLKRSDFMIRDEVPVTSPLRTLLDLAAQVSHADLEHAVNEALVQRLVSIPQLVELVREHPGRAGVRLLRSVTEEDPRVTRSPIERRFLSLLRNSPLPLPETNARVGTYEVDFLWREAQVIVETDGWTAHSSRSAFERDRRRDAELVARGYRVIRVTKRRLDDDPAGTLTRIACALAAYAQTNGG